MIRWIISDMAQYVWAVIRSDSHGQEHYYNLLTGDNRSLWNYIEAWIDAVGSAVWMWADPLIDDAYDWISALGVSLTGVVTDLGNWADYGDLTVTDFVVRRVSAMGDAVVLYVNAVVEWARGSVDWFVSWGAEILDAAITAVGTLTVWYNDWAYVLASWYESVSGDINLFIDKYLDKLEVFVDDGLATFWTWYNLYFDYYEDIYDRYHEVLLDFLDDPATYLSDVILISTCERFLYSAWFRKVE